MIYILKKYSFLLIVSQNALLSYEANDEGQHQRNERGDHGSVQGSYSYVDPNGNLRRVNCKLCDCRAKMMKIIIMFFLDVADEFGFRPSGDIGVDRETEAAGKSIYKKLLFF